MFPTDPRRLFLTRHALEHHLRGVRPAVEAPVKGTPAGVWLRRGTRPGTRVPCKDRPRSSLRSTRDPGAGFRSGCEKDGAVEEGPALAAVVLST